MRLAVLYHTRITQHIRNRSGQSEIVLSQTSLSFSKRVEDMVCVLLESVSVHVCESGRESVRGKRFGAWELSFIPSSHHLPPLPPHHGHRGHCYTCTWGERTDTHLLCNEGSGRKRSSSPDQDISQLPSQLALNVLLCIGQLWNKRNDTSDKILVSHVYPQWKSV